MTHRVIVGTALALLLGAGLTPAQIPPSYRSGPTPPQYYHDNRYNPGVYGRYDLPGTAPSTTSSSGSPGARSPPVLRRARSDLPSSPTTSEEPPCKKPWVTTQRSRSPWPLAR